MYDTFGRLHPVYFHPHNDNIDLFLHMNSGRKIESDGEKKETRKTFYAQRLRWQSLNT